MLSRKLEQAIKTSSRRFGKNTICNILSGGQIISFLQRNSLLPQGFVVLPDYGLSPSRNRVIAVPQYDMPEVTRQFAEAGIGAVKTEQDPAAENQAPQTIDLNQDIYKIQKRTLASASLVELLRQVMVIVYVNNPAEKISDIDKLDILIDSVDVMGTITGTLVPKTSQAVNPENWND